MGVMAMGAGGSRMAKKAILLLGLLCLSTGLAASALPDSAANDVPVIIYRPAFGETQITARLNPGLCVAFSVPDEWRRDDAAAGGLRLVSSTGEGEIEIASRSIRELNDLPQGNVSARDAALLQRDHEEILGRKAQASAVETMEGATRWTATWIDASLPAPSHSITVETFIVPASREWLLEVSVTDIDNRGAYDKLVAQVLSNIRTLGSAPCARTS